MTLVNKGNRIFSIKKSKNGLGLFLNKNIKLNQIIVELKGKLITCDVGDDLDEETRSNAIRFNNNMFLSPKGEAGNFINHSCSPNSKIVKKDNKLFILSTQSILKDTEITFDYSTILARDDIWQMKCNCKSLNCRKIIKKFDSLPKKIKESYVANGYVPKYILNIK